jgi:DNA excision repair protein ERCC-4
LLLEWHTAVSAWSSSLCQIFFVVVRVVADSREPDVTVQHLAALGVAVERRRLGAGDYQIGDKAIVERKTVGGLHAAVTGGTFWPQLGRVRRVARFPYLLIEGTALDRGPLSEAAVRGVCVAVMDLGVCVIRSMDARDSALWLHRLAERRARVRYRNQPAYAQRPKREVGGPAAEGALGAVPGISAVSAQALLGHFGSLAAVARSEPAE